MNTDNIARKISNCLLNLQSGFALFMGKQTAGLSTISKKIMFIVVCLLFTTISTSLIVHAIISKPSLNKINITHIRFIPPVKDENHSIIVITQAAYNKLQLFKRYMDSLRMDKTGKKSYDSILISRPGIMDSVTLLEKIYVKQ